MINLAGDSDCDAQIIRELREAGIEMAILPAPVNREVSYSVVGRLGDFHFKRAWYYWVVNGPVPLDVALELYSHPIGRKDVRVTGHCGCPPPEDWARNGVVNLYHIDSQSGLNLFVRVLEEHALRYHGVAYKLGKRVEIEI